MSECLSECLSGALTDQDDAVFSGYDRSDEFVGSPIPALTPEAFLVAYP
jgi:hypothetical protein